MHCRIARAAEEQQRKQAEATSNLLESVFRGLDNHAEGEDPDFKIRLEKELDLAARDMDKKLSDALAMQARLRNALGTTQLALGEGVKAVALFQAALDDLRTQIAPDDPQWLLVSEQSRPRLIYNLDGHSTPAIMVSRCS